MHDSKSAVPGLESPSAFTVRWHQGEGGGALEEAVEFVIAAHSPSSGAALRHCGAWEAEAERPWSLLLRDAGGSVAGHAALWPKRLLTGRGILAAADIGMVVVAPNLRGRGLTYRLFEAIETQALEMGLDALVLGGNPELYRRFGFTNNTGTVEFGLPRAALQQRAGDDFAGPLDLDAWQALHARGADGNQRVRPPEYWRNLERFFASPPAPWFAFHSGDGRGMVAGNTQGSSKVAVRELLAADPAAIEPLLTAVAARFPAAEELLLTAATGSPLDQTLTAVANRCGGTRRISPGTLWKALDGGVEREWYVGFLDRR